MREGWWPDSKRPEFPLVLGTDGSGTIAAVGSRVRRFTPGERVYAYSFANPKGGFYAEYVAVAADRAGRPPADLSLTEAGAIPATGLTAIQGVDDVLQVRRGEAVVIHGAAGGVGSLALQFAKMRGARVLATASGRDGIALVRRLGADAAVDGRRADLAAAALAFAPGGVDAVLAFAGGKPLTPLLNGVRHGGRVAFPNGVEPAPASDGAFPSSPTMRRPASANTNACDGRLRPPSSRCRPARRTRSLRPRRRTRRLAKRHVLGKIVLRVAGR